MDTESHRPDSIFLGGVRFYSPRLCIGLVNGREIETGEILFHVARAFRMFSESDNYLYLKEYGHGAEVLADFGNARLLKGHVSGYLTEYITNIPDERRDGGEATYLLLTDQECIETISFEDPVVTFRRAPGGRRRHADRRVQPRAAGHRPKRLRPRRDHRENVYDAAGQRLQVREGVGTAIEAAEASWAYNLNGQVTTIVDGNGNRAEYRYDDHGRQGRWVFPSPTEPTNFDDSTPATGWRQPAR